MGSCTLWAGGDHLLLVELRGFTEMYRRFYFRDVQAIIIRPTERARTWSFLLALSALGLAALASGVGAGWNIVGWILAGLALIALIVNLSLGRSCECTLQTPLQTVALRSLRRLRRARGVLERIRPLIELEQGPLANEEALVRAREAAATGSPEPAGIPVAMEPAGSPAGERPPVVVPGGPPRHESGRVHEALSYVLLLSAAVTPVPVLYFNVWLNAALCLLFLGRLGCIIAALVRQKSSDLPIELRRFAWTAFGWECGMIAAGFACGVVVVVRILNNGALLADSPTPFSPLTVMNLMRDDPGTRILSLLSSVASLSLGVWGLVLHRRLAPSRREPWRILPI